MRAMLLLALLLVASPAQAADFGRYVDDDTVGHFRTWSELVQASYVRGMMTFSIFVGVSCQHSWSVAEYMSALRFNASLKAEDKVAKAMMALYVRNGCEVK